MTIQITAKKTWLPAVILLLPFLMFYWMLPFVSGQMLGTDYINYHVFHQLDLLFSIKTGSFPLYAPACYYGQSSVYPHAQLYHPLGYLASLMPGFWNGCSLEWLTLFRLLCLGICHFCLFRFLRKMNLHPPAAFLISLITVYNLRMLALFWNVIALESYTGTLFLCAAIGFYYLKPTGWRGPLLVVTAFYWLVTSDFPPMVFYGLGGTIVFTLTLPFLHNMTAGDNNKTDLNSILYFWGKISLCFAAGLLLSSAYLLPFFLDYMQSSSGRIDQPYLWAAQWTDTLPGFFNNFFFPLGSGFSMFGGSPLFLAAVISPLVLIFFRFRIPKVVWVLFGIIVFCFLYMQGARTPVHYWAWKYVPLISALRGPGRISLVLPLLLMMIWIWLLNMPLHEKTRFSNHSRFSPVAAAALTAMALTVVYILLPDPLVANSHYGCPCNIRSIPAWVKPAIPATSILILGLVAICFFFTRLKKVPGLLILALTVFQLLVILRFGPNAIAPKEKTPTYRQLLAQKRESINFQPVFFLNQHAGSRTVVRQLKNYFMQPQLAKIYRRYTTAENIDAVYRWLNNSRQPEEMIVENHPPRADQLPTGRSHGDRPDRVELTYSSYNRLVFSARAGCPSFFVFSYPFSGRWHAKLDGQKVPVYRANGAAQAVRLPPGRHVIEFFYQSRAAFYGMLVSCLALGFLGGVAGIRGMRKPFGYFVATTAVLAGAGIFFLWFTSLYSGDNLQTEYVWQSPPPDAPVNLAFGKPTQMSSHKRGYPYLYNSRHAVDGGREVSSCFFTDRQKNSWWQVDLKKSKKADKVVIYIGFSDSRFNTPPLILSVSKDGKHWRKTRIDDRWEKGRMEIVFESPETFRYLNIKASGTCMLSLNEVEVY